MLKNEYFTKDEIIKTMQNAEEYTAHDFYDLFQAMFNNSDYIIGTYEASEALATYKNDEELDGYKTKLDGGVGAVVLVERYELDRFGNILSPLFNEPEEVAHRVEYIRGEKLFRAALSKASLDLFEATTEEKVKKFVEAAKEL